MRVSGAQVSGRLLPRRVISAMDLASSLKSLSSEQLSERALSTEHLFTTLNKRCLTDKPLVQCSHHQ